MRYHKTLTPEQALQKIRHYCAYQERSHQEVKEKLYSYGLRKQEVEELISSLIEDDYLNEQRFATAYVRGKFRMKQWGRQKILHNLKQKQVSPYCVKIALQEIDPEEYQRTLEKIALEKWNSITGEGVNRFVKLSKTTDHLLRRGYEPNLIQAVLVNL